MMRKSWRRLTPQRPAVLTIVGFLLGYLAAWLHLAPSSSSSSSALAAVGLNSAGGGKPAVVAATQRASGKGGLLPAFKDFHCGVSNMGVPPPLNFNGSGLVFVDVGLNEGEETFAAVRNGYTVFGFEPVPNYFNKVQKKLKDAGLQFEAIAVGLNGRPKEREYPIVAGGFAYLFNAAAGDRPSSAKITVDGPGSSFSDPYLSNLPADQRKELTVPVVAVGTIVKHNVRVFKTDTQGFDAKVIEGARALFQNHQVDIVITEFWPRALRTAGSDPAAYIDLLTAELGYVCFDARTDWGQDVAPHFRGHPFPSERFMEIVDSLDNGPVFKGQRWGWFEDVVCVLPKA